MFEIFFDPTASATAYGQRPKFVRAKHSATAEGENCTYGPTLFWKLKFCNVIPKSMRNMLVHTALSHHLDRQK